MPALLLFVIRFIRLLYSGHQAIAIENVALRVQLAAFRRRRQRPVLNSFDRVFWITLHRLSSGWRGPLMYVQPDSVPAPFSAWQAMPCSSGDSQHCTDYPDPTTRFTTVMNGSPHDDRFGRIFGEPHYKNAIVFVSN